MHNHMRSTSIDTRKVFPLLLLLGGRVVDLEEA